MYIVFGYLSHGLNSKIPHCIYCGTIPDAHILDLFLHLQMKVKRYMYTFNIITVLILLFYTFFK